MNVYGISRYATTLYLLNHPGLSIKDPSSVPIFIFQESTVRIMWMTYFFIEGYWIGLNHLAGLQDHWRWVGKKMCVFI